MTGTTATQRYWEDFYRDRPVWSGRPNALLVAEVADLPPGTALDLGCAEGADAVWLAARGWRVTGADASASALRRAAAHAAEAGVEVDWQGHDLARTFPDGDFDLVCASYLHSPPEVGVDGERPGLLRRAAAAVALGGLLLVVGHHEVPPWGRDRHPDVHLPTPDEVLAGLELDPAVWRVERAEVVERAATGPDGEPGTVRDSVVRVRRA